MEVELLWVHPPSKAPPTPFFFRAFKKDCFAVRWNVFSVWQVGKCIEEMARQQHQPLPNPLAKATHSFRFVLLLSHSRSQLDGTFFVFALGNRCGTGYPGYPNQARELMILAHLYGASLETGGFRATEERSV